MNQQHGCITESMSDDGDSSQVSLMNATSLKSGNILIAFRAFVGTSSSRERKHRARISLSPPALRERVTLTLATFTPALWRISKTYMLDIPFDVHNNHAYGTCKH